jgi:hypothetical protein
MYTEGAVTVKEYLDGTTWKLEHPNQRVVNISVEVWRDIASQLGWEEEVN